ncbi:hydroxymyristoyl-ACP dehydratase [Thiocapsa rosea]|uniref:Putative hotdog family 3-hydroxylacyl-ACP dehydratase n=1 Tax=Thiocapsa rosea TaxID=69360 RepID=A0A495V2C1_9GAMM|nr:hydroxymyristoyl-ACP dehydratase [Thiocapsa rosea]RKT43449.1 putative hotdog family 3-hydroxylacyl-ACP dehydratase [Thiocapsa rosea]
MTLLDEVYAKLPHAGAMCLLEEALEHDRDSIRCATTSHRDPCNPLRRDGTLSSVQGVEYAAQAAAAHGVLTDVLDGETALLLGAVRDLELSVARLDCLPTPLQVTAWLEARAGVNAVYRFELSADERVCVRGRITLLNRVSPRSRTPPKPNAT